MTQHNAALSFAAVLVALSAAISFGGCALQTTGLGPDEPQTPCSTDAQCEDNNTCTADSCGTDGLCVNDPVADGPSAQQTPGDCKTTMCQGGQESVENDSSDVEDDNNDCTTDSCNAGQIFHTAKPKDTACSVNGASGRCDDFGKCQVDCSAGQACDDKEPCTIDACDISQGVCIFTPLDGIPTPGSTPTAGDCRVHICVGGKDTNAPDDTDLPNDNNECTDDVCTSGTPSNPPRMAGTFCNGGADVCDGAGQCADCNVDADCSGVIDDCQKPTCDNHVCKTSFTAVDTPVSMQNAGDCKEIVCNGTGGTKVNNKDTDLPVDGNDCTADICTNGVPSHMNLASNAPCGVGGTLVCNGSGQCVGCVDNTTCTAPATCGGGGTQNVCGCTPTTCAALGVTCGTAPDGCGGTLVCNDGTKNGSETDIDCGGGMGCGLLCAQGKKCTKGADCQSGACADGVCCNTTCSGACQACTAAKKGSGADGTCGPIKVNTDPDNDCNDEGAASCGNTGSCDGSGACQKYPNGTVCSAAMCADSTTLNKADLCNGSGTCVDSGTQNCSPQLCMSNMCAACTADAQCGTGQYCTTGGNCAAKKTNGTNCGGGNQCLSGNCVDGVCCDKACGGACEACTVAKMGAGVDGICGPVIAGNDPDNDCAPQPASTCGTTGACDGAGACQKHAMGTVCNMASCAGSTLSKTDMCDGMGTCVDGGTQDCMNQLCSASTNSCVPCATDAECGSGKYCDGMGGCQTKKNNGGTCTATNQCSSGFCAPEGICCNNACNGTCEACGTGTCTPIADGADPDNECAAQMPDTCGTTGMCNGAGACKLYSNTTVCGSTTMPTCIGDDLHQPDLCNGSGMCVMGASTPCAPFGCNMGACRTSCSNDGQCVMTAYCDTMNACQTKKADGSSCGGNNECQSNNCDTGTCAP